MWNRTTFAIALLLAPLSAGQDTAPPPRVSVFLLAGQSNMEGQAVVDLDHPKYYNGGRGILTRVLEDPEGRERWGHLRADDGSWTERDDVFVWYRTARDVMRRGKLSIGYSGYADGHHFGPELQIGHVLGDRLEEPVLLVKTAWGGKSLAKDFRPPSAGGDTGPYYELLLEQYREALAGLAEGIPELAGHEPVLRGFVWFQGWNDMVDEAATAEYEQNLVHLIGDLRAALGAPELPVVVGETGNCNNEALRGAQRAACSRPEVGDRARFVPTAAFRRAPEDSPNTGHGHHWFGNAESYLLIGDAMGRAMAELLSLPGSDG